MTFPIRGREMWERKEEGEYRVCKTLGQVATPGQEGRKEWQ